MVGVGVAEGGGEPYYGEYYPPEQYFVPQEMCPHPHQHPQHAHMCTVHTDYGGMPVVTSGTMMPPMMQPVLDDMRHYIVHHPPHQMHHPPPHQLPHHQQMPPQHQPHHYGPANGAGGPQHFYPAGYQPHYHIPPHPMQHYPPPPVYQKDERAQRQHTKLKQKLERKHNNRTNGIEANSGASTPSLSPRKELNGRGGASSGAWSEGEGSSAGASMQSDEDCDTQAFLDQLSAKRTPQVSEVTSTSALVQWNSPLPEGVPPPPHDLTYDLLLGDRGRYKAIYSGPKLSCRVCDLRPGCEYSVRLQIRAGEAGATSEEATFSAAPAPPARPAAPRVTVRARSSLQLRWAAAADHGARIAHYVLELDAGEGWVEAARPRARHHTVPDLRAQTRYRFRLAAVNECGRGEWSEEVVAWTAGAPPPAPRPPRLVAATASALDLAWERRADEEFTLQLDEPDSGHGFLPVYSGPDDRHTAAGLRRATDYRFRLRAETPDGQGPWSADVTYRTLPEPPAPPARPSPRGKVHSRSFRLRWDPPPDDGGAPVESYTLELDDGSGWREAWRGREREALCERLQPGAEYRARVRCSNPAGDSAWSAPETVSTEPAAPAAPPAPTAASPPRATAAAVRWRAPACLGGAALAEYRVELREAGGEPRLAYCGADTECVLRELRPGAAYEVTVTAVNRVGPGAPSPPLAFTAAPAPPDAPPVPSVTLESPRSARLEWTPPNDNGAPILDYRLEMSTGAADASFAQVFAGLATSALVGDLTPFTAYFFRVCASNAAGRGAWSGVRDALTERAPPAAPAPPAHEAEAAALRLAWAAPAAHGAAITHYLVRVDERELRCEEPALLVTGLRADTQYRVRVCAVSELGAGAWSEPARCATRPPPPAPPRLACLQRAHNYVKLRWGEGEAGAGTQYRLELRAPPSRDYRVAYRGSARSCKVKKLREDCEYAFRIRASDERGGRGEWGPELLERTGVAPPPAPRAPALALDAGRVLVSWEPVEGCEYAVQTARGGAWRAAWAGSEARCELDDTAEGELQVRVGAARGGAWSAWGAAARLQLPARAPARRAAPRPARAPLAPRHAALLMAGGFLLLAVLVAAVLQRLVEPRP
ncbi:fibronectin type-III domain-containing protein 3a isoform X1 [Plutella xylostella]|uniref:fibronectin type-III domain-containing protein 3a isoform X1 n=1 Tax=Plutella xylostella TaxID=51655 RepID=UPI00203293B2|nr:fibronectin type-III domain-containing protein 3a isoform X1 [Plutella xylostella]